MFPFPLLPLLVSLVGNDCSGEAPKRPLSREEAIRLAERFIRENGYTDHEISPDAQIANESFEMHPSKEKRIRLRFNTLNPKAAGAKQTGGTWTVGFEYTDALKEKYPVSGRPTGRAVRFDAYGNDMQVMHKDLFLDILE